MNVRGGVYSALDGGVGGDGQLFGHWNSFFFSRCWLIKWGWRWRWGRKGEEGEGGGGMMVKATRWPAEMLGASPVKASAASSNAVAVLLFSPLLIPLFGFWHFNRMEGGEGGGGGGGGGRGCWNRLLLLFFPRTWRFVGQVAGLNLALRMTSPSHVMRDCTLGWPEFRVVGWYCHVTWSQIEEGVGWLAVWWRLWRHPPHAPSARSRDTAAGTKWRPRTQWRGKSIELQWEGAGGDFAAAVVVDVVVVAVAVVVVVGGENWIAVKCY